MAEQATQDTPQESQAEQYELPDSRFDDELDQEPVPSRAAVAPAQTSPAPETRERGADGKFLPKKYTHTKRLQRIATDFGIAQEEIDSTPPEQLDDLLYHLNRQLLADRERRFNPPPRELPAEQPAVTAPVVDEDAVDWGTDEEGKPYDENAYQKPIAKTIKTAAELRKKNKELEERLARLEGREVERMTSERDRSIDSAFSKLGAAFEPIFGKGDIANLAKDSDERAARIAIVSMIGQLKEGTLEQRIAKAAKLVYGRFAKNSEAPSQYEADDAEPTPRKPAQRNGRITQEDWEAGALARPTQREAKPQKGTQAAYRAVAKQMKDKNINEDDFDNLEERGLPD